LSSCWTTIATARTISAAVTPPVARATSTAMAPAAMAPRMGMKAMRNVKTATGIASRPPTSATAIPMIAPSTSPRMAAPRR
jgi:hypothetical protein